MAASEHGSTNPAGKANGENMKAALCAILSLSVDSAEDAVVDAVKKLKATETNQTGQLQLSATQLSANEKALALIKEENVKLQASLAKIETDKKQAAVDELVLSLEKAGSIKPDKKDDVREYAMTMGVEKATALFSTMKPVVELGEKGITGKTDTEPEPAKEQHLKFKSLVEEKVKAGTPRADAHILVARQHPELAVTKG
jgi:flagellar hook-length control protein FliK